MDEFDIEVVGAGPQRRSEGPVVRLLKRAGCLLRAALMRPRVLVFGGAVAFALAIGTPHVGWDYECNFPARPGQPCGSVNYCGYYGVQGRRIVVPGYGESCKLVTFLRIDWQRIVS